MYYLCIKKYETKKSIKMYKYFPSNRFNSYNEYIEYLKMKGFAVDIPN